MGIWVFMLKIHKKNRRNEQIRICKIRDATIIKDKEESDREAESVKKVFTSFISDLISNFNSDLYYQNPSYIEESYVYGELLD